MFFAGQVFHLLWKPSTIMCLQKKLVCMRGSAGGISKIAHNLFSSHQNETNTRKWIFIIPPYFTTTVYSVCTYIFKVKFEQYKQVVFYTLWGIKVTKMAILNKSYFFQELSSDFRINTSYLTDSYIVFTLKMESESKNTIFGLKMIVKT